jgi:predicted RNase H-like HicB family nuclease
MKSRSFTVIIYKEDDMYIAECPEVGTVDQGETIKQAIAGLKETTRLYLEEFPLSTRTHLKICKKLPTIHVCQRTMQKVCVGLPVLG